MSGLSGTSPYNVFVYLSILSLYFCIQHMMNSLKDTSCGIFLKRGLFKDIKNVQKCSKMTKDIKNYIPKCSKMFKDIKHRKNCNGCILA